MDKQDEVLYVFGYAIEQECNNFAINQMIESDFILLKDANFKPTENVRIQRGEAKELYTIKNSCKEKYNDFYSKKLNDIIEKFIKSNA